MKSYFGKLDTYWKAYIAIISVMLPLAISAGVLFCVKFVPWNLAFKNGVFDSPEYRTRQAELINANKTEYNIYRACVYTYLALYIGIELSKIIYTK